MDLGILIPFFFVLLVIPNQRWWISDRKGQLRWGVSKFGEGLDTNEMDYVDLTSDVFGIGARERQGKGRKEGGKK